jgi:hypothetical protein
MYVIMRHPWSETHVHSRQYVANLLRERGKATMEINERNKKLTQ